MNLARTIGRHGLGILLGLAVMTAAAEAVWWWRGRAEAQKVENSVATLRREFVAVQQTYPAPTSEAARNLAQQVELAELKLATWEGAWLGGQTVQAWQKEPVPADRRTAYFDLADFRQRMTALAAREHVSLRADEAFGFGAYLNEGPAERDIADVFRERLVLEEVLGALLRCRPTALAGVARATTNPSASTQTTRFDLTVTPLPAALSVRHEGLVHTRLLEVGFRGGSEVLREWLNALATSDLPVLVRNVRVQPATVTPTNLGVARAAGGEGFQRLVSPTDSVFTVSLEYVEWVAPSAGEGAES